MNKIKTIFFVLALLLSGLATQVQTFTNPLSPSSADPWSIYKDGNYYYMHTLQDRLMIWKTKN